MFAGADSLRAPDALQQQSSSSVHPQAPSTQQLLIAASQSHSQQSSPPSSSGQSSVSGQFAGCVPDAWASAVLARANAITAHSLSVASSSAAAPVQLQARIPLPPLQTLQQTLDIKLERESPPSFEPNALFQVPAVCSAGFAILPQPQLQFSLAAAEAFQRQQQPPASTVLVGSAGASVANPYLVKTTAASSASSAVPPAGGSVSCFALVNPTSFNSLGSVLQVATSKSLAPADPPKETWAMKAPVRVLRVGDTFVPVISDSNLAPIREHTNAEHDKSSAAAANALDASHQLQLEVDPSTEDAEVSEATRNASKHSYPEMLPYRVVPAKSCANGEQQSPGAASSGSGRHATGATAGTSTSTSTSIQAMDEAAAAAKAAHAHAYTSEQMLQIARALTPVYPLGVGVGMAGMGMLQLASPLLWGRTPLNQWFSSGSPFPLQWLAPASGHMSPVNQPNVTPQTTPCPTPTQLLGTRLATPIVLEEYMEMLKNQATLGATSPCWPDPGMRNLNLFYLSCTRKHEHTLPVFVFVLCSSRLHC